MVQRTVVIDPGRQVGPQAQSLQQATFLDQVQGREIIGQELSALMKVETMSAPRIRGGRYFFTKRSPDQDFPVIFMREGAEGEDRVLIDPNGWEGETARSAQMLDVSRDGTILAYAIREGGQDEIELRFLDVDAGTELPDGLEKARYMGGALTPDKRTLYYSRHGDAGPRIYRHRMGTLQSADQVVFGDAYGIGDILYAQLSDDGRYLLITVAHGSAGFQELYLMDLARGGSVAADNTATGTGWPRLGFHHLRPVGLDPALLAVRQGDAQRPRGQHRRSRFPQAVAVLQANDIVPHDSLEDQIIRRERRGVRHLGGADRFGIPRRGRRGMAAAESLS